MALFEKLLKLFDGRRRGFVIIDPASKPTVLPFTSAADVVFGDGTVGPPPSTVYLVTGEEPPVTVSDGAGHPMTVI